MKKVKLPIPRKIGSLKKTKAESKVKAEVSAKKAKPIAAQPEKISRLLGLENLKAPKGAHKKRKLLGRGPSSGHGKTSTRGSKGQTSRAGRDFYPGFEGGQTPLIRRFPKRGFFNINNRDYQVVNLESLAKLKASEITPEILKEQGLIKSKNRLVKILGKGSISSAIKVKAHAFSTKAQQAIIKAGGTAEIIKEQ